MQITGIFNAIGFFISTLSVIVSSPVFSLSSYPPIHPSLESSTVLCGCVHLQLFTILSVVAMIKSVRYGINVHVSHGDEMFHINYILTDLRIGRASWHLVTSIRPAPAATQYCFNHCWYSMFLLSVLLRPFTIQWHLSIDCPPCPYWTGGKSL